MERAGQNDAQYFVLGEFQVGGENHGRSNDLILE
jgi:hypothetical protein